MELEGAESCLDPVDPNNSLSGGVKVGFLSEVWQRQCFVLCLLS